MKGRVNYFDEKRGFGKIDPEGGGPQVFVHILDIVGQRAPIAAESVEFDLVADVKGPKAISVKVLDQRLLGRVLQWGQGSGLVQPHGTTDQLPVHYTDIIGGANFKKLEASETVEFSIEQGPGGRKAVRIRQRPALEWFAILGMLDDKLRALVNLAEKEDWNYRKRPANYQYPILRSYIYYTFARLQTEGKIAEATTPAGKIACFNSGLVTPRQEPIFGFLTTASPSGPEGQNWTLQGFLRESDRQLTHFAQRPDIANYFGDPSELLYDTRIELVPNIDHIVGDNLDRFPAEIQKNEFALRGALDGAINAARKRVRRNYKAGIPQFYRGKLQLLLPLCLNAPDSADLALVVARENQVYRASTVLTLDMAYNNARLIARPDTEWLNP